MENKAPQNVGAPEEQDMEISGIIEEGAVQRVLDDETYWENLKKAYGAEDE